MAQRPPSPPSLTTSLQKLLSVTVCQCSQFLCEKPGDCMFGIIQDKGAAKVSLPIMYSFLLDHAQILGIHYLKANYLGTENAEEGHVSAIFRPRYPT